MRKIILVAAVLALTVPSLFIFKKHEVSNNASFSGSFMEDVRVANRDSGKERWILKAKKVVIPPGSKSTSLQNVSISLPEQQMEVTSDSGVFDIDSRDLELTGNIEARSRGYVLKTDSALLRSGTNEITSDDKVVLEGNNFVIEGDGFHADSKKKVILKNNVKATFF